MFQVTIIVLLVRSLYLKETLSQNQDQIIKKSMFDLDETLKESGQRLLFGKRLIDHS